MDLVCDSLGANFLQMNARMSSVISPRQTFSTAQIAATISSPCDKFESAVPLLLLAL